MKNKIHPSAHSTPAHGLGFAVLGAVLLLAAGCSSLPQSSHSQLKAWQLAANFSAIGHALTGADKAAERFGQLLAAK
jgi:hypothetical protein